MKFLLVLAFASLAQAVSIHSVLPKPSCGKDCLPFEFKISDGLLLHWTRVPERNREAIEAFDRDGTRLSGVDLYQFMPSAGKIEISDVAMSRDGSIAIAAVTVEKERVRSWLMQVNRDGHSPND